MKNILILSLTILSCFSCKAQIIAISENNHYIGTPIGGYYRDTNNLLNPYEGTWLYTNGTTSITVKLRKITNFYNGRCYQDMLVGEYQYIENGIVKINTLSQFNTNFSDQYQHNLDGNSIYNNNDKPVLCNDCNPAVKRVLVFYDDPLKDTIGDMYFGISNANNNIARVFIKPSGLKWTLSDPNNNLSGEPTSVGITIPNGWYNFVKQ